jgi:iron complex outermembrane recepter protein
MTKNAKLRRAIQLAMLSGAYTIGMGVMATAHAQQAGAQVEEITVTGSRVRDANLFAASPVTTVTREEFDLSGATRVEDLLNTIPNISPSFSSFDVNPSVGFATVDLYGLGTNRTLTLINGRRVQSGGIRSQAVDLNQIPAALVQRVEVLTGGASAVYGSDAMAGVVNFILDNTFEGVSINGGYSGYQHDNSNSYIQGLMDQRGFTYPTGSNGIDGEAYNLDIAVGSPIAEGRGHAMAYFTYRENKEVRQGARDYSSCALSAAGTSCGGSSTSPIPSFAVSPGAGGFLWANIRPDGSWAPGQAPLYNYAPINFLMRPDERWTLGSAISFEINSGAEVYLETNVANTKTRVQIAESGTFFVNALSFNNGDALIGSMYTDLGLDPAFPVTVQVGKRNNEGGPRTSDLDSTAFRGVLGVRGAINPDWDYDVSYMMGRSTSSEANNNDFLTSRLGDALLQCPPGAFGGCVPYNVWVPNGVTAEAAATLGGTGMRKNASTLTSLSAYVTGVVPFTVPTASEQVSVVAGMEYRDDRYANEVDANMRGGNFAGQGGPRLPISGSIKVSEVYFEAGVPLYEGSGFLQSFNLDTGLRYSDYSTSGGTTTYKLGFVADIADDYRVRGGFNRAIRAANIGELFSDQQIALWGGEDPCAGATPQFTPAQCANTGVTAAQYGTISSSPASQYNQFIGGNTQLAPEQADTFTLGVIGSPLENLTVSLDYYNIEITERIGTIGASTILRFCGLTGDSTLCNLVNRNRATGDLWLGSNPATSGLIRNLSSNFGDLSYSGMNLNMGYRMPVFRGDMSFALLGTYTLEQKIAPLPGINETATYDCAGVVNTTCTGMSPDWRHTARVSYSQDRWTASVRWRHIGEMDYRNTDGSVPTTDRLLVENGNKLKSENYVDLTAVVAVMENFDVTIGVNNVFNREVPMVGAGIAFNANAPVGYDMLGRYMHATFGVRF